MQSMNWLEAHYKENFFLYIDTWDPHEPFNAPNYYTELYWPDYDGEYIKPPYAHWQDVPGMTIEKVRKSHASYCGKITMVDTWLGYFLRKVENMGLMKNTAIIFTTDHGLYFGEHGGLFGKMTYAKDPDGKLYTSANPDFGWTHSPLYEELIACPLFIYVPGISSGTFSGLTSAIDLAPTVMDILGQKMVSQMDGQSLLSLVKNSAISGREYVVSGREFTNKGATVRVVDDQPRLMHEASGATITTSEWSFLYEIEPGLSELFHLPSDPKQEWNIISERQDVAKQLHQLLINFMRQTKVPSPLIETRLELRL
jgi:arylsulfatase A-like enzyme